MKLKLGIALSIIFAVSFVSADGPKIQIELTGDAAGELVSGLSVDQSTGSDYLFAWTGEDNAITGATSSKGKAIENFRDSQQKLLDNIYTNSSFGVLMDIDSAKSHIRSLTDQFSDVVNEFNKVKEKKDKVDTKYEDIKSSIIAIIKDVRETKTLIDDKIAKINEYSEKLLEIKKELESIQKDIDSTKDNLVQYTNFLYKLNNDYYGSDLNIDDLKLLVKSDNIANTLSNEDIIKSFTVNMNELMSKLQERQDKFIYYTKALNDLRIKYRNEVKDYEEQIDNFTQQKEYLIELIKYYKEDKQELDSKYQNLMDGKEIIKKQILGMMNMTKNKFKSLDVNKSIGLTMLLKSDEKEDSDRFLSWPILPPKRINTFFHDVGYIKAMGTDHLALDIAASQKSEIYAPANGLVYKVFDQDGPWLNRMIIIHKYGYVSIYLHINKALVKEGDYVSRGQVIGLSGGKPGTRGAGLMTSGPHLHYEIIKNGERIDPLTVTDLSPIKSKDVLQQQYYLKYLKDKMSRYTDLTSIDYAQGDTLAQRRADFLEKFGTGPYSDPSLWEDAAAGTNVDVDLGICIGLAETGLGRNFARNSQWNIGNVGNNDRGDRRGFQAPINGVSAIYQTLSNRYLSKYTTIDQLSRFGNKNGSVYASSPENWQRNVVTCLSIIKGYWVPEEYPFRHYAENELKIDDSKLGLTGGSLNQVISGSTLSKIDENKSIENDIIAQMDNGHAVAESMNK